MAEALAEAGADIIGVSATLELSGSEVEQAVTAMGRKFTAYQCDFSIIHKRIITGECLKRYRSPIRISKLYCHIRQ